jgi:hypothetical protein
MSWRASKYGAVKSYDCFRRSLIVTPDTMRSMSPLLSEAKMPTKGVFTIRTCTPVFAAIALMTSTSKPTICFCGFS